MDDNGNSILENSLVRSSTESGDGRHNDSKRELTGVLHAFSGANGRLRTGELVDVNAEGLDVYNTILRSAFGYDRLLGPMTRPFQELTGLLP